MRKLWVPMLETLCQMTHQCQAREQAGNRKYHRFPARKKPRVRSRPAHTAMLHERERRERGVAAEDAVIRNRRQGCEASPLKAR